MAGMAPSGSGLLTELRSSIRDISQLLNKQGDAISHIGRETASAKRDAELASAQFADLRKGLNSKVESMVTAALQETVQRQMMTKVSIVLPVIGRIGSMV